MKLPLPLLLLLPLAACGQDAATAAREAAHTAIDKLAQAADRVAQEVSALDLAALSPEALREKAFWVIAWCATQLEQARDSDAARAAAGAVGQVLDAGSDLLHEAAEELPGRAELRERIERLRAEHAGDEGVMRALDPVLARLSALLD